MATLVVLFSIFLLIVILIQISKINDLAKKIRGEEVAARQSNDSNARGMVMFVTAFLGLAVWSAWHYKNYMMGYGPHESASEHGLSLDFLFDVTLIPTGIVFVITHIALFWFAYKYRAKKGRKALYMPHDNRLEVIWTIIPAIVMTGLVVFGLDAWNTTMADVGEKEDYMEIEATGMQFAWIIRYPGKDKLLGTRDFHKITGTNALGQDWTDPKNQDDFIPTEIVLPVNKKVRVRITSRDVLHAFDLPHFRVKMDAIPGMPTYFVFKPTKTSEEYRQELRKYPEYNEPADPKDPESKKKWEVFTYELACAELCGTGHFSMRVPVKIVSQSEYILWAGSQKSFYKANVEGKEGDPFLNKAQ